jgi:integrase
MISRRGMSGSGNLLRIIGSDGQPRASSDAPSLDWTLRVLFDRYYRTEVLSRRRASPGSVARYFPLLDRWDEFAGPSFPLRNFSTAMVDRFRHYLLEQPLRQSGKSSRTVRKLKPDTIAGELVRLRAITRVLGPSIQAGDGCLGLLPRFPDVDCRVDGAGRKSLLDALRAPLISDFARWFRAIDRWPNVSQQPGLRVLIALGFYTGYRISAILALRHRHIVDVPHRGLWIDAGQLPQSVRKKAIDLPCHPRLTELLAALPPGDRSPDAALVPPIVAHSHCSRPKLLGRWRARHLFFALQRLASGEQLFTVHDWRAGHIAAIGMVGFELAAQMAMQSVGHSSQRVTSGHYWNAQQAAVLLLPRLE